MKTINNRVSLTLSGSKMSSFCNDFFKIIKRMNNEEFNIVTQGGVKNCTQDCRQWFITEIVLRIVGNGL